MLLDNIDLGGSDIHRQLGSFAYIQGLVHIEIHTCVTHDNGGDDDDDDDDDEMAAALQ